jgi:pyruvate/2-oxoglutarate dehydrogenase complex dihydrolipoamide dehydrogenase (E3) component
MVVIGAGAGGLITSIGSSGVGAKVALIERRFMGGDCLNFGCVPSKALLKAAKVAHIARTGGEFGINIEGEVKVDFAKVMERLRKVRAGISEADSVQRYTKIVGVDVFLGEGKFLDKNTVEVNG